MLSGNQIFGFANEKKHLTAIGGPYSASAEVAAGLLLCRNHGFQH